MNVLFIKLKEIGGMQYRCLRCSSKLLDNQYRIEMLVMLELEASKKITRCLKSNTIKANRNHEKFKR